MVLLRLPARRPRSPAVANALPCCPCNVPGTKISTPVRQLDFFYFCCVGMPGREPSRTPKRPRTAQCAAISKVQKAICLRLYVVRRHTKSIKRSLSCTDGIYPMKRASGREDLNALSAWTSAVAAGIGDQRDARKPERRSFVKRRGQIVVSAPQCCMTSDELTTVKQ
jgi:hypothetical protein